MTQKLTREQQDELLDSLDASAAEIDSETFGLPLHDSPHRAFMRERLRDALLVVGVECEG